MSKHNNSIHPCTDYKCRCGRYITIGEAKARGYIFGQYECPNCFHHRYDRQPLTSEQFYKQFQF